MPRRSLALLSVVALALGGCAGGAQLTAHLDAPAVTVSASRSPELHFVARARTSERIADGEVQVAVHLDNSARAAGDGAGQVRVTVQRDGDQAPNDDVVPCTGDSTVHIPTAALSGCDGECAQPFTVVFSPEGLDRHTSVELPVVVDATISYESASTAPAGDALELVLH